MPKFYFTYGDNPAYPFIDGWSEVSAPDVNAAILALNAAHPDYKPKSYAFCYTEDVFRRTDMYTKGNFGAFAHEYIGILIGRPAHSLIKDSDFHSILAKHVNTVLSAAPACKDLSPKDSIKLIQTCARQLETDLTLEEEILVDEQTPDDIS